MPIVVMTNHRAESFEMAKKFKGFHDCSENVLIQIQSFEMSPYLICLKFESKTLLWPASGLGRD